MANAEPLKRWQMLSGMLIGAMFLASAYMAVRNLMDAPGNEELVRNNKLIEESNEQLKAAAEILQQRIDFEREDFENQKLVAERVLENVRQFVQESKEFMDENPEEPGSDLAPSS